MLKFTIEESGGVQLTSAVGNFSLLIFIGIFRFLLILFAVGNIFPFIFVGILVILLSRALFILAVTKFKQQLVFVRILIFLLVVPAWNSLSAQIFFTRSSGFFHSFLAVLCTSWLQLLTDSGSCLRPHLRLHSWPYRLGIHCQRCLLDFAAILISLVGRALGVFNLCAVWHLDLRRRRRRKEMMTAMTTAMEGGDCNNDDNEECENRLF
jgi:hypothetical protein